MSYVNDVTYVNDMSYVKQYKLRYELCKLYYYEYFYKSFKNK